jgi:hypothetical protein
MSIAEGELGIHENSPPGENNRRILEYHQATTLATTTDEAPWCSSFVNWVMKNAGRRGTGSALASSWLTWGGELNSPKKRRGHCDPAKEERPGCRDGFGDRQSRRLLRKLDHYGRPSAWRQSERFRKILKLLLERLRREGVPLAIVTQLE